MKKTVRILSMILSAGMLFSIAGCGKKEESSERTTKTKKAAVTTEDTSDTSSEESTDPSETTPDPSDLNNNGVSDYEEDADNDGLSDGQERDLGLDPRNPDTDYDGLEDALEVSTGNDPLTGSELFRLTKEISGENVTAGLDMNVDKEALTSITLDLYKEDALINSTVPGYIGSPITASASGRIGLCQITFDISDDVKSKAGADFCPTIYALNPETNTWYEFLTVSDGNKVSAYTTYLGTFILLDKTQFEAAREKSKSVDFSSDPGTDSNNDGISDFLTALMCDGTIRTSTGTLVFGSASFDEVQANDDIDGDGKKNGEEFTLLHKLDVPADSRTFDGRYYKIYDTGYRWDDVESLCESYGGHLLTITSEEESIFVKEYLQEGTKRCYWLGANDVEEEGTFVWVTGEPFEFTDWAPGEPNNDGAEDYLEIETWNQHRWNDGEVDGDFGNYSQDNHGFICEWETAEIDIGAYVIINE